ncbi:MAG: S41 family peptidase [Cytophagales bacterium]|nr:S41 family peptidase [Cytophagales bacterium]
MADSKSTASIFDSVVKFREILTHIDRDYVDDVDTDKLVEDAIGKMLEKLDPHSVYLPKSEVELAQSQLKGEFEGIGIEFIILKDTIQVVAPLSGGPSERLGIMAGDKIISVDGETVAGIGITNRGVMDRLRGEKGTTVKVDIKRKGMKALLNFAIIRDKIPQTSVDVHYMINAQVGYIRVSRFAATTYDEFKASLDDLLAKGMKKLILDLQTNPGGYMDRAINMADEFISGNKMIVYTDGKGTRYDSEARAYRQGVFEKGALIVLINEGSASASEIVSGAIQDNDRGLIVGRRSFGKGLVQMPIDLSDGSELRLTISRYYTPSGRSIQKPYDENLDDYNQDYMTRYEKGEFFHKDSIKFADSLQYTTLKGRIVYGGGGIMPDYFVPFDTNETSGYFSQLIYSNTLKEYSLDYLEKNKKKLAKMSLNDFKENFEVTDDMVQKLVKLGEENEVKLNQEELNRSKRLIKIHLKAFIARGIWESEGYFSIWNETNEALLKALELLDEAEALANRK